MRFPTYDTVDLFAGAGGWSVACRSLGLHEIGIETDKDAHMTRRAAGFHTIRADVRSLGPGHFPRARGLIAGPPCQPFSAAGKGAGRRQLEVVLDAVRALAGGDRYGAEHPWSDARTGLVLEPLRWALDAHEMRIPYRWIALEQVPAVLPVWETMADVLRNLGYSVTVGNLQAEQYGVPQTRKRAILVASLDRDVRLPTPTHSRFHARDRTRLDPGVKPWVSMADALGWADRSLTGSGQLRVGSVAWVHERPATTIVGSFKPEIVAAPGYRVSAADGSRQNAPGSVRVTLEEASALQSFPRGFPWRGSKTKRYQQVGNAIPPLLAEAVLRTVL